MAKRTILKLIQDLGSAIQSDEIDSLTETVEVIDMGKILERTYKEVISRKDYEFTRDKVLQLDARDVADTKLNNLTIPLSVTRLQCVKYVGANGKFTELCYKTPKDFINLVHARNVADSNITAILNDDGVAINTITDAPPNYYTSFDEETLTFDAYDSSRGVGNLVADSVIIATIIPAVDFTDPTAVLPIPERLEPLIFTEAQATMNYELRQTADPNSERRARKQGIALRDLEPKTQHDEQEINYGRRPRSGR